MSGTWASQQRKQGPCFKRYDSWPLFITDRKLKLCSPQMMPILAALLSVCVCSVMWRRAFSTIWLSFVTFEKSYQREQLESCFLLKICEATKIFVVPLHQLLWHWHWCCCWPGLQLLAVVASAAPLAAWPGGLNSSCTLNLPPAYSACLLEPCSKSLLWPLAVSPATWPLPCRLNWPE